MQPSTLQLSRKARRITLLVPLVLALLLTILFILFGGGHRNSETVATIPGVQGINMTLPSPQPAKGKSPDKLEIYHQMALDSTRRAELQKADPYFAHNDSFRPINSARTMSLSKTDADQKADHLLQQLDEMKQALAVKPPDRRFAETPIPIPSTQFKPSPARDPELDRIDGVLEKLIRVQHPDLIRSDSPNKPEPPLLLSLQNKEDESQPGFMDITENTPHDSARNNSIPAEITADQTLTTASSIELRLTQPVMIEGHPIPKDQLVRGTVILNGERLSIAINSIRIGGSILPVALQAYDLDGIAGIRIPGAILRDASKESADQTINSVAAPSIDPSLGAQAANAGLQFARSLATKKVRLVQVTIPAGYQVLLKNVKH